MLTNKPINFVFLYFVNCLFHEDKLIRLIAMISYWAIQQSSMWIIKKTLSMSWILTKKTLSMTLTITKKITNRLIIWSRHRFYRS